MTSHWNEECGAGYEAVLQNVYKHNYTMLGVLGFFGHII